MKLKNKIDEILRDSNHELAKAMGFKKSYKFSGTQAMKVKQIGNAVPVKTAKSLCYSMLSK